MSDPVTLRRVLRGIRAIALTAMVLIGLAGFHEPAEARHCEDFLIQCDNADDCAARIGNGCSGGGCVGEIHCDAGWGCGEPGYNVARICTVEKQT